MRLQDVLKEREQEIAHLESSLKKKHSGAYTITPATSDTESGSVNGSLDRRETFSPKTINQFEILKTNVRNGHEPTDSVSSVDHDESLQRLNELMRYIPAISKELDLMV